MRAVLFKKRDNDLPVKFHSLRFNVYATEESRIGNNLDEVKDTLSEAKLFFSASWNKVSFFKIPKASKPL